MRKTKYTTGEAEEEEEESDSDDDDNESPPLFPANGHKTHGRNSETNQLGRARTASQGEEAPSTACWKAAISEANTSYERILRNYLAK